MEDIEKILQQYGKDRRQQQDATEQILHIARRQRSILAAMACTIVILATTVWTTYRLTAPHPTGTVTLAWQGLPVPNLNIPLHTVVDQTTDTHPSVKRPETAIVNTDGASSIVADSQSEITEEPDVTLYTELPSKQQSDSSNTQMQYTEQNTPETPRQIQFTQPDIIPITDISNPTISQPVTESDSRINFTASVGAFAMSRLGSGATEEIYASEMNGVDANNTAYTAFAPINSFSANMGVTYTILKKEKYTSRVGLIVCGQAQQGDIVSYELVPSSINAIDGGTITTYQMVENPDTRQSFNIFSIYAGIPLVLDLRPSGKDNAGWSISLTPAHTILSPRTLGNAQKSVFVPNPWKLTLGVGVSLPRRFPRKVSLTANLLSVSTSLSLHEIGFEIGF